MELKELRKEIVIFVLASIILSLAVSFKNPDILIYTFLSFLVILGGNILVKKIVSYHFETKVYTKFWSLYQFGFKKESHFKRPVPMVWLPLVLSLITKGLVWWFAILEFDVAPKTERIARRHGLYRFTQVTEWHMAWIAIWGITANILMAIIGYLTGYELFAKLATYYALWSIIPISSSDGSKIFFSNRALWTTLFIILLIFFGWAFLVI